MKKLITLLLVVMLAFSSFAACGNKDNSSSSDKGDSSSVSAPDSSSSIGGGDVEDRDPVQMPFNFAVDAAANITYDTTPLEFGSPAKAGEKYTYRGATNSLPTNWNSHTYQSNSATTVLDYTTDSLFTFDYNLEMNGYRIVPSMAKGYPTDVTSEYVGKWDIDADSANRVYKIELKDNLKFDDGSALTAETFVESMKRLLAPEAANYRADSYFSGNLIIAGARDYALQGSEVLTGARNIYESWEDAKVDPTIVFDLLSDNTGFAQYCVSKGYNSYKDAEYGWGGILANGFGCIPSVDYCAPIQGKNFAEISADPALLEIWNTVIGFWQSEPNEELDFFGRFEAMPAYAWEDVGFFAEGNSIVVVNQKELSGFYLLYSLATDFLLVNPAKYDECITTEAGVYTNSYATSKETYVGFGPYRVSSYKSGNHVYFEKNPYWHGYADEANANFYWTTNIEYYQLESEETRLNMFLAGDTDSYGLQAKDMADYQGSEHTYYTDGDSTWFIALNPNLSGLEAMQAKTTPTVEGREVNKTILTVKEFRQALSFSVDRAAYALALDPLGGTAKAIFGNMIISDPLTGTAYRTTEEAKDVILKFWGLEEEVGPDGIYATKDEAIASITGYDLAAAKSLFDQAYDIAVAQGLIKNPDNFEIAIEIGQPGSGSSAYYNNGYELLKQVWTDAVVGTKLEGKLVFTQSQPLGNDNFSEFLKQNDVDVLFGVGWTGSTLDPFGLMEAYVSPNYQYDPGWNTAATMLDIDLTDLDGVSYTLRASVYDWGKLALNGGEIRAIVVDENGEATIDYVMLDAGTGCAAEIRLAILAAVEGAVLQQYDMIPVNLDSSANLKGMKIKYGTEEYVFGVGRGGIKYMTYNYTDAEWAAFVAANAVDGQLNYK